MKETNPKLTSQKKREANKYISYIFKNTGIKFRCKSIKDYIFLKTLYLILISYEDVESNFYIPVANHYGDYESLKKKDYFGYSLKEILKQYIVKYYYQDLTNFAVIWEYYNFLTEDEFEDRLDTEFTVLGHKIDKNEEKITRLLDNISVQMIREAVKDEAEEEGEEYVQWHAYGDSRTCKDCKKLDKKVFPLYRVPYSLHPNCRCYLTVVYN